MINSELSAALRASLSFAVPDPDAAINAINERFDSVYSLLAADFDVLADMPELGESGAYFVRVAFSIASRRVSDTFRFGRVHTEDEILDYFKAICLTETREVVYCMFFDGSGKALSCEFINEGTVGMASVLPRRMLEMAIKKRAASIIIAHNHPAGSSDPSVEDVAATGKIAGLFLSSGKKLLCHYVIAGMEHTKIDCPST